MPLFEASDSSARVQSARLAFLVGFPLALGVFAGWNRIGVIAPYLNPQWGMIYWLLLSMLMWFGMAGGTLLVRKAGRRLSTPWLAEIVVGAVVGVILTRPFHAEFQLLFLPLATIDGAAPLPVVPRTVADWSQLFTGNGLLMGFWIGGSLFFSNFVGYAPFAGPAQARLAGHEGSSNHKPSGPPGVAGTALAQRLTRLDAENIIMVKAEDHYLRAYSADAEELVLHRFADAVAELLPFGWHRVHRSYCVRGDAIVSVKDQGRSATVHLADGSLSAPVSERYVGHLRHLTGRSRGAGADRAAVARK